MFLNWNRKTCETEMLGIIFGLLFVTSLALGSELDVDLVVPDANDNENEFVSVKLAKIGENGNKSDIDVTVCFT